jgi:CheY-like chemotaxis protein
MAFAPLARVLVVDDNRDCADSTALLLRAMGHEARACYDGPTALLMCGLFRPDVCIIDLSMPEMDGDVLSSRMMAARGWRPRAFMAVTGKNDATTRARLSAAGFHAHLVKPADPEGLFGAIGYLLQLSASGVPAPVIAYASSPLTTLPCTSVSR